MTRAAFALLLGAAASLQETEPAKRVLLEELAKEGVQVDLERGIAAIPAAVLVREDLLEYLLVGPRGATHESLFITEVRPSVLNAALLLLGVEPGWNARWESAGTAAVEHRVLPPEGDGFLLYAAWREGDEIYFFRIEDLVANLASGQSMRRHRWVYLGSRLQSPASGEPEVFVADLEQNLINLAFFYQGNTLVTAALPECVEQTIWVANAWLVPPREAPVELLFARTALERLPEGWEKALPKVEPRQGTITEPEDGR